jgi:hypothetical protein
VKNKKTVNLWDRIDDDRAEKLNGGDGSGYMNIYIGGDVGTLQYDGNDKVKLNLYPLGKAPKHYNFHHVRKCSYHA